MSSVNLSNLTTIYSDAFERTGLTTVTLNPSLSKLPNYCFYSCPSLSSINLENVTSLGGSCFAFCSSLESISLNSSLTTIPVCCFSGTKLSSVEIPSTVTAISSSAFNTNTLKTLTMYDVNTINVSSYALPYLTDVYYRSYTPGKTASDLETEYSTRYGSNNQLKPTTSRTVHYVPYEDWNV